MEVRMKHNSCRKALVFVLFASILISFAAFSTFASNPAGVPSDYEYVGQTTRREGGFLGIGVKTYIYESYRETYDTFAFYPSMSVCPQFYHRYNGSAFTLNYSQTVSISSISGVDFSESIGLSVNEDIVAGHNLRPADWKFPPQVELPQKFPVPHQLDIMRWFLLVHSEDIALPNS